MNIEQAFLNATRPGDIYQVAGREKYDVSPPNNQATPLPLDQVIGKLKQRIPHLDGATRSQLIDKVKLLPTPEGVLIRFWHLITDFFWRIVSFVTGKPITPTKDEREELLRLLTPVKADSVNLKTRDNAHCKEYNVQTYQDTLAACRSGYEISEKLVTVPSSVKTIRYTDEVAELPPVRLACRTQFKVFNKDCLEVAIQHQQMGANPVCLNNANGHHPGGGVKRGSVAQEEDICRRTNLMMGLESIEYPLTQFGGLYSEEVHVFRNSNHAFMETPVKIAVVSAHAYDLGRETLSAPDFEAGTKKKLTNMLRTIACQNHTCVVLGAIGCGAFRNDPYKVAKCFKEIFETPEFKGRFTEVDFAILTRSETDDKFFAFQKMCDALNS